VLLKIITTKQIGEKVEVFKLEEAGFDSAMYGFSLSYRKSGTSRAEWWTQPRKERTYKAALVNAGRDKGHNKFLEHMQVWLSVNATLEWWKQFDTYRIGMSKQSASTMHTLDADVIYPEHFDVKAEEFVCKEDHQAYLYYLSMISRQSSRVKSKMLPQAYLQEREVNLNYKTIRHIAMQRFTHRIKDWQKFLEETIASLDHPEFIKLEYDVEVKL